MATQKRPIVPISLVGVAPADLTGAVQPEFIMADPRELLVDDDYQRNLSERSIKLIRKVIGGWDWKKFKPPVVARTEFGLEVIDGQHTATAAATHPEIRQIPVMVVQAPEQLDRADAFLGHNRDRLAMTPMQMHAAAVVAGDEDALTVQQVCERAGLKVLKSSPGNSLYQPGDTLAVGALRTLVSRRGAMKARMVLEILGKARLAPVNVQHIKSVECLMFDPEFAGQAAADDITSAFIEMGFLADQEAKVFSATHSVPIWRAMAVVIFRKAKRGRRRAA